MDPEEKTQEQHTEETPAFTFQEVPADTNQVVLADAVELKEEEETPADTEDKKTGEEPAPTDPPPGDKPEVTVQDSPEAEPEPEEEILELDEAIAFDYLKKTKGLEFDSIEDLIASKKDAKIDPEYEKFQEYKAKTGRGFSDFLETQKDWSKESPETIIKAVLKIDNPDLSNDDIDFLYDKDYKIDEEMDDEHDKRSKQINLKVDSNKALKVLEKQKEDYMVDRGSDDSSIPEDYKQAKELVEQIYDEQQENEQKSKILRNDFVSKTQSVLNDKFEGFKFKIDGQDYTLKPEDMKQTREAQLDIANFQKSFFDKDQKLADSEGYHRGLYFAMNPEKVAQHFFELGKTAYAEELDKKSKNIDVEGQRHIPEPALSGFTFKEV